MLCLGYVLAQKFTKRAVYFYQKEGDVRVIPDTHILPLILHT